ncbi:MAG: TIGR01459 family HAD-type hydrolase [Pseudomonadota bacterium]
MTRRLATLTEVADRFDAIVLDQWGVLHDGTVAYSGAVACLQRLRATGSRLAVLSNSGKRAAPNQDRISGMGFAADLFDAVMTSGEALWQDVAAGRVAETVLFAIERAPGDAAAWAEGLGVTFVDRPEDAQAVLLMGLPDGAQHADFADDLDIARSQGIPVLCTNPDRASPRANGEIVLSPGALAHAYAEAGGTVRFYGKPHGPVFSALEAALGVAPERLLMVGDSLEHDIAGGHAAGWSTAFVEGGLHAGRFVGPDPDAALVRLVAEQGTPSPDFTLSRLE